MKTSDELKSFLEKLLKNRKQRPLAVFPLKNQAMNPIPKGNKCWLGKVR